MLTANKKMYFTNMLGGILPTVSYFAGKNIIDCLPLTEAFQIMFSKRIKMTDDSCLLCRCHFSFYVEYLEMTFLSPSIAGKFLNTIRYYS